MGAEPLLTHIGNGGNAIIFVAGYCDIDKKIRIHIARNSILFEVSDLQIRVKASRSSSGRGMTCFGGALALLRRPRYSHSNSFLRTGEAKERTLEETSR